MEMGWRWDFTYEILPQMAIATLNTILAAGVGYAIALIVGLFFLLAQRTPSKIFNWVNRELVEFIRSTPLLIQLFFVYLLPHFSIRIARVLDLDTIFFSTKRWRQILIKSEKPGPIKLYYKLLQLMKVHFLFQLRCENSKFSQIMFQSFDNLPFVLEKTTSSNNFCNYF